MPLEPETARAGRRVTAGTVGVALLLPALAGCSMLEGYRSGGEVTDAGRGRAVTDASRDGSEGGDMADASGTSTGGSRMMAASESGTDGGAESSPPTPHEASSDGAKTISCGTTIIGSTTTIDFGCPETFNDFEYLFPLPNPSTPPLWAYLADVNPNLWEVNNAASYPNPQDSGIVLGAVAVYRSPNIRDGSVSARVWTSDSNGAARLIARYRDPLHFYRFAASVGSQYWSLMRLNGDDAHVVGLGSGDFVGAMPDSYPGRSMRLDFVGKTISVFVDGVKLGEAVDDDGYLTEGRVGIEIDRLGNSHIDDFSVTTLR